MNNDYVPLGWEQEEVTYNTDKNYNPHGLNDDKACQLRKSQAMAAKMETGQDLDFGEAYIYDYRLRANEVIYGD